MKACRRTAGLLNAWLDAGQLGERDARHLARCRQCKDAFARVEVAHAEIGAAVRALVFESGEVEAGPAATPMRLPARIPVDGFGAGRLTGRFAAALASLASVVFLVLIAGIGISSSPAAPTQLPTALARPLLPVLVGPAEQALHESRLRCTEIATGIECARQLAGGWRQIAQLEVAGATVRRLEVRLDPGTAALPLADVAAALSGPVSDVLGVDLSPAIDQVLDGAGVACGCSRPIDGGVIRAEGNPAAGYLLVIEAPD